MRLSLFLLLLKALLKWLFYDPLKWLDLQLFKLKWRFTEAILNIKIEKYMRYYVKSAYEQVKKYERWYFS